MDIGNLKPYFDEKFLNIDRRFMSIEEQIKNLSLKIDTEHDKILSTEKDCSYLQSQILECKQSLERRKEDFNNHVDERIGEKIKTSIGNTDKWIMRAINVILAGIVAFMAINFIINPVRDFVQKNNLSTQEVEN